MSGLPDRLYRTPGLTQKRMSYLAFVALFIGLGLAADLALCLLAFALVKVLHRG